MKKLFRLFAIILAMLMVIVSLVSCSEPFEPGRGKNSDPKSGISIISGDTKVQPHSELRFIQSYNKQQNMGSSADGIAMFQSPDEYLQKNEDKIPAVNSKDISIDLTSRGKLTKVEIYTRTDILEIAIYDLKRTITLGETDIFEDAEKVFSSLSIEGTYYVVLQVYYEGELIETDNGPFQEGSEYSYYFKIVIQ